MSDATVGFSCLHLRRAATDGPLREVAGDLLVSPAWGATPRYFASIATPGHKLWRRPGMIPAKSLREVVDAALTSESVSSLSMCSARENGPGFRSVTFARDALRGPFSMTDGSRPWAPADPEVDAWVEAVVTFLDRADAGTGVVTVMNDPSEIMSECTECGVLRNGVLAHPFPEQRERMRESRKHMGTRYMRFPRWGTLVSHDHVSQLGGTEAIAKTVEPAIVRPLSGGVYFQLTKSVATAMSGESAAKQRVFTDLAAPLLPPPIVPPS